MEGSTVLKCTKPWQQEGQTLHRVVFHGGFHCTEVLLTLLKTKRHSPQSAVFHGGFHCINVLLTPLERKWLLPPPESLLSTSVLTLTTLCVCLQNNKISNTHLTVWTCFHLQYTPNSGFGHQRVQFPINLTTFSCTISRFETVANQNKKIPREALNWWSQHTPSTVRAERNKDKTKVMSRDFWITSFVREDGKLVINFFCLEAVLLKRAFHCNEHRMSNIQHHWIYAALSNAH